MNYTEATLWLFWRGCRVYKPHFHAVAQQGDSGLRGEWVSPSCREEDLRKRLQLCILSCLGDSGAWNPGLLPQVQAPSAQLLHSLHRKCLLR